VLLIMILYVIFFGICIIILIQYRESLGLFIIPLSLLSCIYTMVKIHKLGKLHKDLLKESNYEEDK